MSYKTQLLCRKCSLFFVLLLVLQVGHAQNQFSKVDEWIKDNLKDLGGRAVLVIYKDGKLVYDHAENDLTPMQQFVGKRIARKQGRDADELLQDFGSNTKIMIASCSKWLSAALVMTFVDEGKLNLEDTVGKYLPMLTANGKGQIKIWQCLSHLTGIKTPPLKEGIQEISKAGTMEDTIEKIAANEMEGEPGKTFHYSNAGLQIAAAVIEKISGKDFKTLFRERIAEPCDMPNTDFGNGNVPLAAGGARSTATDYLHFLTMILNNGTYNGKQILSADAVAAMQVNRVTTNCSIAYTPAEAAGWGYGFGEWVLPLCNPLAKQTWSCTEEGVRSSFASSPGLFGSFPWVDNDKHYAGFLLTFCFKSKGRSERYRSLKNLVDEALQ
ncbi:MAG: beta-lactamase family protein [Chitinophagaceae bacterium]|nr:beta-lactamase family protein [Chitinophagaceae bacterium]